MGIPSENQRVLASALEAFEQECSDNSELTEYLRIKRELHNSNPLVILQLLQGDYPGEFMASVDEDTQQTMAAAEQERRQQQSNVALRFVTDF